MLRTTTLFAVLFASALLILGLPFGAQATLARQGEAVGPTVPVTNEEGAAVGSITITDVSDPFTAVDPGYPAEAGSRFVALTVAFDADAGQRFDIQPWTIVLQDDQGFIWNQTNLVLPDDALVPVVSSETLSPGSRITGIVGFALPEGRNPARIFFQPQSSQLVLLAELASEPKPVVGDAVSIPDSEGGAGTVTVENITDPFEDVEPGQVPPEGTRFVGATLAFENTSDGKFSIEPYGILLQDSNGVFWTSAYVSRPDETKIIPDLTGAQLAPGDRLSGEVIFAVPAETDLSGLYVNPVSGQYLVVADLAGATTATEEPAVATPAAAADETAVSTSGDDACADLEQWLADTRERIRRAGEMSREDAALTDLNGLADHAAEYAQLADEQAASAYPALAAPANKALVATLRAYNGALEQILGANDAGKDTAVELTEGMNTFNDAGTRLNEIERQLGVIATECGLT